MKAKIDIKKYTYGRGLIAAILVSAMIFASILYVLKMTGDTWSISEHGTAAYPKHRASVSYTQKLVEENKNHTLFKISYESKGDTIYSLLTIPKKSPGKKVPGIVLLPGALVTKESEQNFASILSDELGYAVLTLDERGNRGETKSIIPSMEQEYYSVSNNIEPVHHKMIFDNLRAFDILRSRDEVDAGNIIMMGESMGGRFAIMSAAVDDRIKGVVGISTSGYGSLNSQFESDAVKKFYLSIDPDNYIGLVSPRKVVMIHSGNDTIIPFAYAKSTYTYAKEPKKFISVSCIGHGYCSEMKPYLKEELELIFSDR